MWMNLTVIPTSVAKPLIATMYLHVATDLGIAVKFVLKLPL